MAIPIEILVNVVVFGGLIVLGIFAGGHAEKAHLKRLAEAETDLRDVRVTSMKSLPGQAPGTPVRLVAGEACIASDYFKTFVSSLRNLFGGEMVSFCHLYDRARREATVRMLREARDAGFNAVGNVRYISSDIGGSSEASRKKAMPMASILVTGTAYRV